MRHLTNSLKEWFRPLIDMTDRVKLKPEEEEKAFLSRAVTALAVKHATGWSDREAAAAVIDDYSDRGIDAVAVGTVADLKPNPLAGTGVDPLDTASARKLPTSARWTRGR